MKMLVDILLCPFRSVEFVLLVIWYAVLAVIRDIRGD